LKDLSKALDKYKHINVDGVEINLNDEMGKGTNAHLDPLKRLSDMNKKIAENQINSPIKNIKNI
jgi:hypothetical protein